MIYRKGQIGQIVSTPLAFILVVVIMVIFVFISFAIGRDNDANAFEFGAKSFEIIEFGDNVFTIEEFSILTAINSLKISRNEGDVQELKDFSAEGERALFDLLEKKSEPYCFIFFRDITPNALSAQIAHKAWAGQGVKSYDFRYAYIVVKDGKAMYSTDFEKIYSYFGEGNFVEKVVVSEKYAEETGFENRLQFLKYSGECLYDE